MRPHCSLRQPSPWALQRSLSSHSHSCRSHRQPPGRCSLHRRREQRRPGLLRSRCNSLHRHPLLRPGLRMHCAQTAQQHSNLVSEICLCCYLRLRDGVAEQCAASSSLLIEARSCRAESRPRG